MPSPSLLEAPAGEIVASHLKKAFDPWRDQVRTLVEQSYPLQATRPCAVEVIDVTVTVGNDGTVHYRRIDHLRALRTGDPLHYYVIPF